MPPSKTQLKNEVSMDKIENVEKRLADRITRTVIGAWAVVLLLISWLGFVTVNLFPMRGDIQALKQYEKDHGGEIVRNIENPENTEQLAANLSLAAAQLQVARSEHIQPNAAKLRNLQSALIKVATEYPNLPETWQASVQLVNYKFQNQSAPSPPLPNCLNLHRNPEPTIPESIHFKQSTIIGSHCSLSLDDDGSFSSTVAGKLFEEDQRRQSLPLVLVLDLTDANITYSGGKMLPIDEIKFKNCTFDFKPSIEFPKKGKSLTTQLIAANTSGGEIQLPSGL